MSYLVCFECNQYYEVESLEDAADMELSHCECGRELVYFENLEDSYTQTDVIDEPVTEADYRYEEEALEPVRESMANGSTFTEKKASQYKTAREKGNIFYLCRNWYFHNRTGHRSTSQLFIIRFGIYRRLPGCLWEFIN